MAPIACMMLRGSTGMGQRSVQGTFGSRLRQVARTEADWQRSRASAHSR
jgi:hypothetical protein